VSGNERAKQEVFRRFDHLNKALMDASSIIYLDRADFLELLASSIRLFSIPEILSETGPVSKRIRPFIYNRTVSSNDQKLVSCALDLDLPIRRRINNQQYIQYHLALTKFARYSDDIWEYGANVHAAIKELI